MKKLKLNMVVALLSNLIYIFTGIVAQRFILRSYGSEINGLTGSITQLLAYFTLLEAGLGIASVQALYKPLANNDTKAVEGILSATSRQYKKIGEFFLLCTVILSAAMPFISNSSLDGGLVFIITLLMGAGSAVNYLFIGRYQVLLQADRKVYVLNILDSVLGSLFTVIRITLINMGQSIVLVQSVALISPLVRIVILRIYFRICYKNLSYKAEPDFRAISKRKFVFVHQIVGMINSQTAVTILTVMATLSQVSVYSVYNLIYSNIRTVVSSTFATAVEPSFGKLAGGDSATLNKYYKFYELMFTYFLSWLLSVALVMTIPFVTRYTAGVEGINYIDPILAVLFMASIYLNLVRIPALMMVNVSGAFRETQKGAVLEAVINIVVSVAAFLVIGMRGLLLGNCVARLYRVWDIESYAYRHVIRVKLSSWLRLFLFNAAAIVLFVGLMDLSGLIRYATWLQWIGSGFICSALGAVFYLLAMGIAYPREARAIVGSLVKKLRHRTAA